MSFMGKDGFVWWLGVIEDRNDPTGMGRYKVRIFGWHTDNLQELPTGDLPWAQTILSLNGSTGWSNALEGDYVMGFFLDGSSGQFPVVLGKFSGLDNSEIKV